MTQAGTARPAPVGSDLCQHRLCASIGNAPFPRRSTQYNAGETTAGSAGTHLYVQSWTVFPTIMWCVAWYMLAMHFIWKLR